MLRPVVNQLSMASFIETLFCVTWAYRPICTGAPTVGKGVSLWQHTSLKTRGGKVD